MVEWQMGVINSIYNLISATEHLQVATNWSQEFWVKTMSISIYYEINSTISIIVTTKYTEWNSKFTSSTPTPI